MLGLGVGVVGPIIMILVTKNLEVHVWLGEHYGKGRVSSICRSFRDINILHTLCMVSLSTLQKLKTLVIISNHFMCNVLMEGLNHIIYILKRLINDTMRALLESYKKEELIFFK